MIQINEIKLSDHVKKNFSSMVLYGMPDGCHYWIGDRLRNGYGVVRINYKRYRAHRVSYELYKGSTNGLLVCHTCDNRLCVNPTHLFLGTYQDNITDMHTKMRGNHGSRNGMSKLDDISVAIIIEARSLGFKVKEIANYFGLERHAIMNVTSGRRWKHISKEY